jgi:hypothetical protein
MNTISIAVIVGGSRAYTAKPRLGTVSVAPYAVAETTCVSRLS